jgi:hypothetical protein
MTGTLTMEKSKLVSTISPFQLSDSLANIQTTLYQPFGEEGFQEYSSLIPEKKTDTGKPYDLIIEKDDGIDSQNSQFMTYIDTPGKKRDSAPVLEKIPIPQNQEVVVHWDGMTHFYFTSLTVIGLYVFFRIIQKSK